MTSPVAIPSRLSRTWTAFTVMLVSPGEPETICSLSVTVMAPSTSIVVFGAGFTATGDPATETPTRVEEPDDPSPFEVHWEEMTSAVSSGLPPREGASALSKVAPATWAELVEVPLCDPKLVPWVLTFSRPVVSTPGRFTFASESVTGPPPPEGSVTEGMGPLVTDPAPRTVTSTLSPYAPLPLTSVTSADAGVARAIATQKTAIRTRAARPFIFLPLPGPFPLRRKAGVWCSTGRSRDHPAWRRGILPKPGGSARLSADADLRNRRRMPT